MRYLCLLALALCPTVFSQSDDCSTATAISGSGSWAFDTSGFTTSQFDGGGCLYSDADINQDAFFVWRSTFEGTVSFNTFGSSFDTRLRVHRGRDCEATCLKHNDDAGSLQSALAIPHVRIGEAILIQVGGFGAESGPGLLGISASPCAVGVGDPLEDNDTPATAVLLSPSYRSDLTIDSSDPDYYRLQVPAGYRARVSLQGSFHLSTTNILDGVGQVVAPRSHGSSSILWKFVNTAASQVEYQLGATSLSNHCTGYNIEFRVEPDDCSIRPDDAFEDNDSCTTPTALIPGVYKRLLGSFADPDVYEVAVPPGMYLTVFGDMGGLADSISNYAGTGFITCDSPLIQASFLYGYLSYLNATNATQSVLFVVQPPIHLGPECYDYDLSVHLDPDTCAGVVPDFFDQTGQVLIENGTYPDLSVSSREEDIYELCVPPFGTVSIDAFSPGSDDQLLMNLRGLSVPMSAGASGINPSVFWTNPYDSEAQIRLTVRLGSSRRTWCTTYDLVVRGACACHAPDVQFFCPQAPNASSPVGTILSTGLGCGPSGGKLDLQADHGPSGQMGVLLMSSTRSANHIPIGGGLLCLGSALTRFNQGGATNSTGVFDGAGRFRSLLGNGDVNGFGFGVPIGVPYAGTLISAGDTWHFQLWFRAQGGTSNFSTGISVTL